MELQVKAQPHDIEAEQAILGSMFFSPEAISEACESITSDDFYAPAHRVIFLAMSDLFASKTNVDIITLGSLLDERNLSETIGGRDYLVALASSVSTWANLSHYIKIIQRKALLRRLIGASKGISEKSYSEEESIESIVDFAEKEILGIMSGASTLDFAHIKDVLPNTVSKIEELQKNQGAVTGVETHFKDFDRKTAGLQPQDFVLIAARPSMGKTAFALNVAQNAAVRSRVPTAIFSLEMSKEQLVNRLISSEAMLDAQRLRTGELEDEDWVKIVSAVGSLSQAPIFINDTPGISVMEVRSKCRKLKAEHGLGLVMIDYLQLMTGAGNKSGDNRQQEISDISRNLKSLARELNVPVVALSQLSRAVEARADKRPMLSDLRESGAIEQDADVVTFLYRDEYYNPDTEFPGKAELIIAKQRNGPTGTVDLAWLGKYTKFADAI